MHDETKTEHAGYHSFLDDEKEPFGSFEIYWHDGKSIVYENLRDDWPDTECATDPGWYWWACSPGCLPDSDQQ